MADVDADAAPAALIIRGAADKHALLALGSLAFVVVGTLMLMLPPPARWSAGRVLLGGLLVLLLGLVGLGTTVYVATRPILLLYPDRLVDVRRSLTIPYIEIRAVAEVSPADQTGRLARWLSPQWLLLTMHDATKYAALERLSKRWGLTDADLTLDLSLVSAVDVRRVRCYLADRLAEGGEIAATGRGEARAVMKTYTCAPRSRLI